MGARGTEVWPAGLLGRLHRVCPGGMASHSGSAPSSHVLSPPMHIVQATAQPTCEFLILLQHSPESHMLGCLGDRHILWLRNLPLQAPLWGFQPSPLEGEQRTHSLGLF